MDCFVIKLFFNILQSPFADNEDSLSSMSDNEHQVIDMSEAFDSDYLDSRSRFHKSNSPDSAIAGTLYYIVKQCPLYRCNVENMAENCGLHRKNVDIPRVGITAHDNRFFNILADRFNSDPRLEV